MGLAGAYQGGEGVRVVGRWCTQGGVPTRGVVSQAARGARSALPEMSQAGLARRSSTSSRDQFMFPEICSCPEISLVYL